MMKYAQRIQGFGTSVFTEFTQLANEYDAVNLGQGFPNWDPPDFALTAVQKALSTGINQYAPCIGRPQLRQAISQKIKTHYDLEYDPSSELAVSAGASESIQATIAAYVNPGDEVIVFEPYFDTYVPNILFAHGIPRYYSLRAPNWAIDPEQLEALFNDKTKLILLNTPHNPTGKVFSRSELETIARLCQKYDVLAMSDEVYEHILFDEAVHLPLASWPGMRERTIMISSFGKSFSATGWKVGWATGTPELIAGLTRIRQFTTFSGAAPLQEAAATALQLAETEGFYEEVKRQYARKRELLISGLMDVGLSVVAPQGAFYVIVDVGDLGFANGDAFCRHLTKEVGVTAVPCQAFYQNPKDGAQLVRFAFCKTDDLLEEAVHRLKKFK